MPTSLDILLWPLAGADCAWGAGNGLGAGLATGAGALVRPARLGRLSGVAPSCWQLAQGTPGTDGRSPHHWHQGIPSGLVVSPVAGSDLGSGAGAVVAGASCAGF